MVVKQLVGRGETKLQDGYQKMNEEATIKNTGFGINAKGLANVSQSTFLVAATPGIGPMVTGKKGKSFIFK